MKNLILFTVTLLLASFFISCKTKANKKTESSESHINQIDESLPFASRLEWTGAKLEDENYSIWGSSPIVGDDGKIHVFSARWPEFNVNPAWRKSSEVAHYVADSPEGPFVFSDVAVKGSGKEGAWDRYAPHNPEIQKIGDYYAITFVANSDYRKPAHPSNQKIGLVYSKSLYGPWEKAGKGGMVVEVSKDSSHWTFGSGLGVDNPCLNEVDGKPIIYFKNRKNKNGKSYSKYGYAIAEKIEGPYVVSDNPITDNESYLEDATAFTWNNKYYLLTTDNHGTVTGVTGGGILWASNDSKKFQVDSTQLAYNTIPSYYKEYDKNKVNKVYGKQPKFERPKVLMVNDEPAYLFAPSGWNVEGGKRSVCYILKIRK
ncbi:glycoside hydrolase family protein [bacterium]|nr:glycoside hydrolase family protein [bacterium]